MDEKIKQELLDLYINNPKGWRAVLKSKTKNYLVTALNKEFPEKLSLSEKMFWLANNLKTFPKCPVCGIDIHSFGGQTKGYNIFCSCSCAQKSLETRQKLKNTNMKLYGAENPAQSKIVQDKIKQTCLAKYGAENVYASEFGKQKIKATMLKKYGVENCQQSKTIKEKTKKTLVARKGIGSAFDSLSSEMQLNVAEMFENAQERFSADGAQKIKGILAQATKEEISQVFVILTN